MAFKKIKTIILQYNLETTAFISGAMVMILELIGSRILAPYVGTSIYVWTNLIGVILISLSFGYWLGGKIALHKPTDKTLSNILFYAALFIGITSLFYNSIMSVIQNILGSSNDYKMISLIFSLILFAPANILLGMISPYIAQLKVRNIKKTGETVGNLYALSTLGSIVGTFFTGYFLLIFFGSTKILFIVPIFLILLSLLVYRTKKNLLRIVIFILLISIIMWFRLHSPKPKTLLLDLDTRYNRVRIVESKKFFKGKLARMMILGQSISSGFFPEDNEPAGSYIPFFRLSYYFNPGIVKTLTIGGAGYSWPTDLLRKHKGIIVDVVEIDPELTALAKKYFNLKDDSRLTIYHEDGRTFVNRNIQKKYDVIFMDAFKASSSSPPLQLMTKEAISKMYTMLNDNGLIVVNMISAIEGEKGKLLRAEYRTYKSIFPQVFAFPVDSLNGTKKQNIVLIAYKSDKTNRFIGDNKELQNLLNHLWDKKIPEDLPILTDDFAPVEYYNFN